MEEDQGPPGFQLMDYVPFINIKQFNASFQYVY